MKALRVLGVVAFLTAYGACAWAQTYAFTTWAGQVAAGSEDGPVSIARFARPCGVAVDEAGNVYVSDTDNHTIRRVGTDGKVTTLAGMAEVSGAVDGVGSEARFYAPNGVAVDAAGIVYVADSGNQVIRRIGTDGRVSTLAGLAFRSGSVDGEGPSARFASPTSIVIEKQTGNLLVTDRSSHTIRRVTPTGVVTTVAGKAYSSGHVNGPAAQARFNYPYGIGVDAAGNIFVAENGNMVVRKITPAGEVSTLAGSPGVLGAVDGVGGQARFTGLVGLCVDRNGVVWVSQFNMNSIRLVAPDGRVSTLIPGASLDASRDGAANVARFAEPFGLAADAAGNVYVADSLNHGIRRITPTGVVSTVAGQTSRRGYDDGPAGSARLNYPNGLAIAPDGSVYFAEEYNGIVRKLSPSGEVRTIAGTAGHNGWSDGSGASVHFGQPYSVAVDAEGMVYVADFGTDVIRKMTPEGVVTTIAGKAGTSGSDDGQGVSARFRGPEGVAVDRNGTVYVADTFNHTIRRISKEGVVTTVAGSAGNTGATDGMGEAARFNTPRALAVGPDGVLYVADTNNYLIRRVTPAGAVTTFAGTPGVMGFVNGLRLEARFGEVWGITVDAAGAVYVVDSNYHAVRRIGIDGRVTTLGGASSRGSRDGLGTEARFRNPHSIAVAPSGDLYIADSDNNTIRVGRPLDQAAQTSQLTNLSVRADIVSGQRLMVGFVMSANKPVLVRAIGPGLARYLPALTPVVLNPSLELYNALGGVVDHNDNWGGGATLVTAFNAAGAFPLDPSSADAVTLRSIEGSHTAHYIAQGSGVGLIEAYDAGSSGQAGRFSNLSARYRVGGSANTGSLMAGFAIGGTGFKTLLIRGIGPQLAKYGAVGTLADPKLELYDVQGNKIAENDQWPASLASAFAKARAFDFEVGSKDAALLISLPPGLYSAQVSSADGTTGEAMVEVYELP